MAQILDQEEPGKTLVAHARVEQMDALAVLRGYAFTQRTLDQVAESLADGSHTPTAVVVVARS